MANFEYIEIFGEVLTALIFLVEKLFLETDDA
jgi:hypothetical protein